MFDFIGPYRSLIISIVITVVLLILLIMFFRLLRQIWLFYKQSLFKKNIEWSFLELKIPREVLKTPRAMEQFFINLHSLKNAPGDWKEKYIDGEVPLWWSFEIVSFGGKIHFYIRMPKKHKQITEGALYAQYPNVELVETEDYLKRFPETTKEIYESNENIFGSEIILNKEDFYPIITYERFYEKLEMAHKEEQMSTDPFSTIIELLAGIHKEENVLIQIVAAPVGDDWKDEGNEFVDKKMGKEGKKKGGGFGSILSEWAGNFLKAPAEHPIWSQPKEAPPKEPPVISDYESVKNIETKLSKYGFESLIRFIYIAPNPIFNMNFATKGVRSALNQHSTSDSNSFQHNFGVWSLIKTHLFPYVYAAERLEARKQRLFYNYRNRLLPEKLAFGKFITSHIFSPNNKSKTSILVTSELATIYHIPGERILISPHIERVESKRMGPPAGLPIFEEE